jgi:hypothetical protein
MDHNRKSYPEVDSGSLSKRKVITFNKKIYRRENSHENKNSTALGTNYFFNTKDF